MPRHRTALAAATALLALAVLGRAQAPIALPAFGNTFSGTLTRGFWFTSPVDCVITGLRVPNEAAQPNQVVEVVDLGTVPPPVFPGTVTGTQLFYDNATPAGTHIPTSIALVAGNVYGVLGACNPSLGSAQSFSSYGTPAGPFTTSILGNSVQLTRFATQSGIAQNGGNQPCYQDPSGPIARVFVDIAVAPSLHPDFTADVTNGATPLAVQFTDMSTTSSAGGVQSWAWDFDGNGTIDSTLQNPSFVYNACGSYDVALTITDNSNPPATTTKTDFIVTDPVEAAFDYSRTALRRLQFTDTSDGPATSWAWDLDGNGTIDSNQRNPAFTYPTTAPVDVTLTVTRLCSPPDTITRTVVPSRRRETIFDGGNNGGTGWTVLFDLFVKPQQGIEVFALETLSNSPVNTPFTLEVWLTSAGHAGKHTTPEAWSRVASGSGVTRGPLERTMVPLTAPLHVPPGRYGVALHYLGAQPQYTDGNGSNQLYNDTFVRLDLGVSRGTSAGAPFGAGTTYSPRVWNGTIHFETGIATGDAGYGFAGEGCPGSLGVPTLLPQGLPTLGSTFRVDVANLPLSAAFLVVGLNNTSSSLGALPLSFTGVGAPGCSLRASDDSLTG
ncbi:MAG: PKD domain-containing protein, partial [Planctomycetes bacterium]|nr:PKD domain-containing protein [Planctomycetota bacterium]